MNFLDNIIQFYNKPFPEKRWFGLSKNILIISIFTTLFLFIFQPSGISDIEPLSQRFLVCLGFGVTGALAYYLYEVLFGFLFKNIKWTYGKWWWYSLGVLFAISLANFLFIRICFFGYILWYLFPYMLSGVFMFGIPFLILSTLFLLQQEQMYESIATQINEQKSSPSTLPNNDFTILNIPVNQIKFVEALQNYVTIGFLDSDGQLKKKTERTTLKSILKEAEGSSIVRTHRSYLVNQNAIIETSGNAQGLMLTLSDCEVKVPVSRTYVPIFKK